MIYQFEKIKKDVRVCLDMNMGDEALITLDDEDTLSLDDIIESKIEEGVRSVELVAPLHLLDTGYNFGSEIFWKDNSNGWTVLPNNFSRFIVFKMSDWERPVYECIDARDPKYQHQFSRLGGIRGSSEKPVCAIVPRAEGLCLEFFGSKSSSATVERAVYKKLPVLKEYTWTDQDGEKHSDEKGIEISERCYMAAIEKISSLVLYTYGESAFAAKMEELSAAQLV